MADDSNDFLRLYREQMRPNNSDGNNEAGSAGPSVAPVDYSGIKKDVDASLRQQSQQQQKDYAKASADAQKAMTQSLKDKGYNIVHNADGTQDVERAPDGSPLVRKFGSSYRVDQSGNVFEPDLKNPGTFKPAEGVIKSDKRGHLIRDFGKDITPLQLGPDVEGQKKINQTGLVNDAHAQLQKEYADLVKQPNPAGPANASYKSAQKAVDTAKKDQINAPQGKNETPEAYAQRQGQWQKLNDDLDSAKKGLSASTDYNNQLRSNSAARGLLKDHLRMAKTGQLPDDVAASYNTMLQNAKVKEEGEDYNPPEGSPAEAAPKPQEPAQPAPSAAPVAAPAPEQQPAPPMPAAAAAPAPAPVVPPAQGQTPGATGANAFQNAKTRAAAPTGPAEVPTPAPIATPQAQPGAQGQPPPAVAAPPAPTPAPPQAPVLLKPTPPAPPPPPVTATPEAVGTMPLDQGKALLEQSHASLLQRAQDIRAKQEQAQQPIVKAQEEMGRWRDTNAAAVSTGNPNRMMYNKDGSEFGPVATHLVDWLQRANREFNDAVGKAQNNLATIAPEQAALEADYAKHNDAVHALNTKATQEQEAAELANQKLVQKSRDDLRKGGFPDTANTLDRLDEQYKGALDDLEERYIENGLPTNSDEANAARKEIDDQFAAKRKETLAPVQEKFRTSQLWDTAQKIYNARVDAGDKRRAAESALAQAHTIQAGDVGESDHAGDTARRMTQEREALQATLGESDKGVDAKVNSAMKTLGTTPEEMKPKLDDVASLDFGRNGKEASVLSDGKVVVNPKNYLRTDDYKSAVDASNATPQAKATAMAQFPKLQAQAAQELFNDIKGVDPELVKREISQMPGDSDAERMANYMNRGYFPRVWTQMKGRVGAGVSGIQGAGLGLAAMTSNVTDAWQKAVGIKYDGQGGLSDYLHQQALSVAKEGEMDNRLAELMHTGGIAGTINKGIGMIPDFAAMAATGGTAQSLRYLGRGAKVIEGLGEATDVYKNATAALKLGRAAGAEAIAPEVATALQQSTNLKAMGKVFEAAGVSKVTAAPEIAAFANRLRELGVNPAPGDMVNAMGDFMGNLQKLGEGNVQKLIAQEAATGANAAAAYFAGKTGGETYSEAYGKNLKANLDAGMNQRAADMSARAHSIAPAIANSAITYSIFQGRALGDITTNEVATRQMLDKSLTNVLKGAGVQGAIDAGKMSLDTLAHNIVALQSYDPNKPASQIIEEVFDSAMSGGLLGSVSHLVHQGAMRFSNRGKGKAGPPPPDVARPGGPETPLLLGPEGVEPPKPVEPVATPATPPVEAPDKDELARSADLKASDTELAKLASTDPQAAQRADVLRRIAGGEDPKTMPTGDLNAVGYDRGASGNLTPLRGQGQVNPDFYLAKDKNGDDHPIIRDSALSQLKQAAPVTHSLVSMTESEALAKVNAIQEKPSGSPSEGVAKPSEPPKTSQTLPEAGVSQVSTPPETGQTLVGDQGGWEPSADEMEKGRKFLDAFPGKEPIGTIQRKMRLGYNRAQKLVQRLHEQKTNSAPPATPPAAKPAESVAPQPQTVPQKAESVPPKVESVPQNPVPEKKPGETAQKEPETPKSENVPQSGGDSGALLTKWGKENIPHLQGKQQARAAGLLKLMQEALKPYAGAFPTYTVGPTTRGGAFEISPKGELTIDPVVAMQHMTQIGSGKAAAAFVREAMDEEFRHKVTIRLATISPKFAKNLDRFWHLLPQEIKNMAAATYYGKKDATWANDEDGQHESFRQFWQVARLRRMTETAFAESGHTDDLKKLIASYTEALEKLGQTIHPELKDVLDELLQEAEAYGQRLRAGQLTDVSEEAAKPEITSEQPRGPPAATVDTAAHEAATSPQNDLKPPTEAQTEAGNYAKGHIKMAGLDISIENPAGSKRRAEWPALQDHYGYVRRTEGADGDHLDVFIKNGTPADWTGPVFVVNQVDPKTRAFDETKTVLGAKDATEAHQIYQRNYSPGWKGYGSMAVFQDVAHYKEWLKTYHAGMPASEKGSKNPVKQDEDATSLAKPATDALGEASAAIEKEETPAQSESAKIAAEPSTTTIRTFDAKGKLQKPTTMTHDEAMATLRGRQDVIEKIIKCLDMKGAA